MVGLGAPCKHVQYKCDWHYICEHNSSARQRCSLSCAHASSQMRDKLFFLKVKISHDATFNWWQSTICAVYSRNASSLSCLVSRTSIDAVRLLARGQHGQRGYCISYVEVVASVPFSFSLLARAKCLAVRKT